MEIPKKINICGIPYDVKLLPDNFTENGNFGEINYVSGTIRINSEASEPLQMQTLIHEWIHGTLVLSGFVEESGNELLVNALAIAISQTFELKKIKKSESGGKA